MTDNLVDGLPDPTERVGYLLWQTAHLVTRRMLAVLEPFDLTPLQFGALVHVGREPGVSAAEIARRTNLTPQSVQTAMRPLIDRGWVQRRPHPVHKRVLGNFLSTEGLVSTRQAGAAVAAADAELVESLHDVGELKGHLRRVLLRVNPTALDRSSLRVEA